MALDPCLGCVFYMSRAADDAPGHITYGPPRLHECAATQHDRCRKCTRGNGSCDPVPLQFAAVTRALIQAQAVVRGGDSSQAALDAYNSAAATWRQTTPSLKELTRLSKAAAAAAASSNAPVRDVVADLSAPVPAPAAPAAAADHSRAVAAVINRNTTAIEALTTAVVSLTTVQREIAKILGKRKRDDEQEDL